MFRIRDVWFICVEICSLAVRIIELLTKVQTLFVGDHAGSSVIHVSPDRERV